MKNKTLFELLNAYHPEALEEKAFKQDMLELLKDPNCFERSREDGHFTASCWLLNKDETQALLMHHTKLDQWFQLGGHCDGDSDVLAVALKEAQEESGINNIVPVSPDIFDLDIHLIPASSKHPVHYHYDVRFLLKVASYEKVIQNSESKELRWITNDSATLPPVNESVKRMFTKWTKNTDFKTVMILKSVYNFDVLGNS